MYGIWCVFSVCNLSSFHDGKGNVCFLILTCHLRYWIMYTAYTPHLGDDLKYVIRISGLVIQRLSRYSPPLTSYFLSYASLFFRESWVIISRLSGNRDRSRAGVSRRSSREIVTRRCCILFSNVCQTLERWIDALFSIRMPVFGRRANFCLLNCFASSKNRSTTVLYEYLFYLTILYWVGN